ncbi:Cof-type HAD-IIB family hydrolase [Oceanobacillus jeddahense]|uniref:Cof-type HAD-IIB family hydrolase n=1 Tax=Oceanobacillus jeddahense TaxID=1462527 RepID=UPI0005961E1E|nr:Cof-type HAD-IIB family hydrolase [Oceanobacillus jeddahense]
MNLISIDMDGTLLSDDDTISLENKKAIYEAQEKNNIIVISSGRSLHDMQYVLKQEKIKCPFIAGNGATTFYTGNILQQFILPSTVLKKIINTIEKNNMFYKIYTNQGVYIMEEKKKLLYQEIAQFEQDFTKDLYLRKTDEQYTQQGLVNVPNFHTIDFSIMSPYKVFVLSFNRKKLEKLYTELAKLGNISMTSAGREKLEIAHGQVSKGNALKFIAEYFRVPLENTFAIGDNLNDISMFKAAGKGIAMKNAEQEVMEYASFVTKNYNDNGVAYALRNYILV